MPICRSIMGRDLRGNALVSVVGEGTLEDAAVFDFQGKVVSGSLGCAAPGVPIVLNYSVTLRQVP